MAALRLRSGQTPREPREPGAAGRLLGGLSSQAAQPPSAHLSLQTQRAVNHGLRRCPLHGCPKVPTAPCAGHPGRPRPHASAPPRGTAHARAPPRAQQQQPERSRGRPRAVVGGPFRRDVTTRRGWRRRHFELAEGRRRLLNRAPRPPRKPAREERGFEHGSE